MSATNPAVVAIAAGGTGGHIFPGIAVGAAISRLAPQVRVIYLCGDRPLEAEIYQKQGISPIVLPARQVKGGLVGKIAGASAAAANVIRAYRILQREGATTVAGFGGYTSGPTVLAGKLVGARTLIHEANSVPGKSNKILARFADYTTGYFPSALNALPGRNKTAVGMPLRQMDYELHPAAAKAQLQFHPDLPLLLVTGGSQGAKKLYEIFLQALPAIDAQLPSPLQILWSTGANNYDWISDAVANIPLRHVTLKVQPFIHEMSLALAAADFAVARAGASTIAELVSFGVYGMYVPLPTAIYDHQTANAVEVEKAGAGSVLKESSLDPDKLAHQVVARAGFSRSDRTPMVPDFLNSRDSAEQLARLILG